jgi:hypothetical protein
MNRRTLLQYGVPIGAIVIFVGSIIAVASCGEENPSAQDQAVLSAYQQGYLDGYSKGYAEGFTAGSRTNVQSQAAVTVAGACPSCVPLFDLEAVAVPVAGDGAEAGPQ